MILRALVPPLCLLVLLGALLAIGPWLLWLLVLILGALLVIVDDPHVHHDALEFPDGLIVKVTRLVEGQIATVLQLPATLQHQDRKSAPQTSTGTIEA